MAVVLVLESVEGFMEGERWLAWGGHALAEASGWIVGGG